ncbi:MAG: hypothetical protein HC880_09160, partial [Bacteroidia bacterium]|nr:hypothetical protein [Bacteroidia bacterium]
MKNLITNSRLILALVLTLAACDQRNDDVVEPLPAENFPQIVILDDEEDGDLEDEDNVGIVITLVDRVDPSGEALDGTVVPLSSDITLTFEIKDPEGFSTLSDYIVGLDKAFFEINDGCDEQEVSAEYNPATGVGSVTFPAGVEEIEIEFELNPNLF